MRDTKLDSLLVEVIEAHADRVRVMELVAAEQDELRAEVEEMRGECKAHGIELTEARAENERLRATLQRIKDDCGRVCDTFELCTHRACQSSYEAWAIADAALQGETPESANAKALDRAKAY